MPSKKITILKAFKTIIWPRRNLVFIGLVLIVISKAASFVAPISLKYLMDDVIPNDNLEMLKLLVLGVGLALPYAGLTFGSRRSNITFSAGYGLVWDGGDSGGELLFSVAGMTKIAKNASFVFDSFIVPGTLVILIPGLRFQSKDDRAFQFGFGGGVYDGDTFPLPFIGWFRKF